MSCTNPNIEYFPFNRLGNRYCYMYLRTNHDYCDHGYRKQFLVPPTHKRMKPRVQTWKNCNFTKFRCSRDHDYHGSNVRHSGRLADLVECCYGHEYSVTKKTQYSLSQFFIHDASTSLFEPIYVHFYTLKMGRLLNSLWRKSSFEGLRGTVIFYFVSCCFFVTSRQLYSQAIWESSKRTRLTKKKNFFHETQTIAKWDFFTGRIIFPCGCSGWHLYFGAHIASTELFGAGHLGAYEQWTIGHITYIY